jgi:hypothetical protein
MTHGENGEVYGIDDELVPIDTLVQLFEGENCPALKNKPKVFIIQACRGSKFCFSRHYNFQSFLALCEDVTSSNECSGAVCDCLNLNTDQDCSLSQFLSHEATSSSAFSNGQSCLSNVHCRLVELLQVAKQLLLDFGSQMDSPASVMYIVIWWSCPGCQTVASGLRFRLAGFPPSVLQVLGIL